MLVGGGQRRRKQGSDGEGRLWEARDRAGPTASPGSKEESNRGGPSRPRTPRTEVWQQIDPAWLQKERVRLRKLLVGFCLISRVFGIRNSQRIFSSPKSPLA